METKKRKVLLGELIASSSQDLSTLALIATQNEPLVIEIQEEFSTYSSKFDRLEPRYNTNHQEISRIPHENRGPYVKNLKGRGFMKQITQSFFQPVDIKSECQKILSLYQPMIPDYDLLIARLDE